MENLNLRNFFFPAVSFIALFCSCANQLPPSGGEDDKIPPKIISIFPQPNTVNFKNDRLVFRFDEYVDRRSFEESFFIFPKPGGDIEFDWSGKEVEVKFSKPLKKNITYVVTISNEFKDVRGANRLESQVSFAFSTGNRIDVGKISGKVHADNYERIKILAFHLGGKSAEQLNPSGNSPDYITQVLGDGGFKFTNLSEGGYRLFAIKDEDRNNLFDKEADKIAVLADDIFLAKDSSEISNANFLLKKLEAEKTGNEFLKKLKADSVNFIYSNITGNDVNIPLDYKLFFYFRNNDLSKADIVNNFSVKDSSGNKSYRLVFNWLNDSLLEVFSTETFRPGSVTNVTIDLSGTNKKYRYSRNYSVSENESSGNISGGIVSEKIIQSPLYVTLINKENIFISYSKQLIDSLDFKFESVPEGNYVLFSYIDKNENGKFDEGNYFPFIPSEGFVIYETDLKVKGSWNVDNVFLKY